MSKFGLKDILVVQDRLYVSIIFEKESRCFTNSILVSQMGEILEFNEFLPYQIALNSMNQKNLMLIKQVERWIYLMMSISF